MNQYVTGAVIKELREKNKMTQRELAEKLAVSDKAVSKWETADEKHMAHVERVEDEYYVTIGIRISSEVGITAYGV